MQIQLKRELSKLLAALPVLMTSELIRAAGQLAAHRLEFTHFIFQIYPTPLSLSLCQMPTNWKVILPKNSNWYYQLLKGIVHQFFFLWHRESRSLGTKWKPKNVEFRPFIDPSGQNQLYHTPLLSKIWDLNNRQKIVNNPFKANIVELNKDPTFLSIQRNFQRAIPSLIFDG